MVDSVDVAEVVVAWRPPRARTGVPDRHADVAQRGRVDRRIEGRRRVPDNTRTRKG